MLHVDIPSPQDLQDLSRHRAGACVSIYLPTTPITPNTDVDRLVLKNLAKAAIDQLESGGTDKRDYAEISDELDDLIDDGEFWRFQANSLAVFVTPDNLRTFRLPSALAQGVHVSDRFHLKPLLRATTFCNSGYVLALAEGSVRLVEVSADLPAHALKVEGMPKDAASAVGQSSIAGRAQRGRLVGLEGQKVRMRQYARAVDAAIRPLLTGVDLPLVIAAVDNLAAIYRSVCAYPHLASQRIATSPERTSEADLAAAARPVFDEIYSQRLAKWRDLYGKRTGEGRTTTDIAQAARGATYGLVHTLMVDMDGQSPGTIDETTGEVRFASESSARSYGVVDEIARRTLQSGGEVLSVRSADIPGGKPLAAIFRHPF